jgi:ferrous iron transport protein B
VIIFIPQIAILFFLLGVLEHTGYLSRISFISDAFLRKFGLSGKSIIPLMSSWACAIPAIMGTRVIDDPKERLAIIMASPLMTCSARLPVYTILIAVIMPQQKGSIFGLQGLAFIGVVATLAVALYYSKRSKVKSNPFWSLELPVYRMPNWRNIFLTVYMKTKSFVVEAGKVILAISIIIWFLSTNSPNQESYIAEQYEIAQSELADGVTISKESFDLEYSYLGHMGKFIEPAIAPLGYDWKIGIAVLSSFAAREVFVGTLATIYSIGSANDMDNEDEATSIIKNRMQNEVYADGSKVFTFASGISLLLFYAFAMQCMSTLAIVKKETNSWKWPMLQLVVMTSFAYLVALIAFQFLK